MGEGPQHPPETQWDPNAPSGTLVAMPPTGELGPQALMLGTVGPRSVELVPEPGEDVYEMTSVALHCRVSAQPLPDAFEWFRDGRTLGQASKDLWVLRAVGIQASGRYRCRATNSIASADSPDVTITVYCKGYGLPWDAFGTPSWPGWLGRMRVSSSSCCLSLVDTRATILRKTFLGLGVGLSSLLLLGTLGCFLRRR